MKILVILLLLLSLAGGAGFGVYYLQNAPEEPDDVYDVVMGSDTEKAKPTKVTTEVSYTTFEGDTLTGFFVTKISGNDTIFEFTYDRLYTPEESIQEGTDERIKTVSGVISYHDGVFMSGDEDKWRPGVGTALELNFNLKEELLLDPVYSEDGNTITAKIKPENAVEVLGTDINAVGNIDIVVETNGVNLTMVTIEANTRYGVVSVRTSYTYGKLGDLFPEADSQE